MIVVRLLSLLHVTSNEVETVWFLERQGQTLVGMSKEQRSSVGLSWLGAWSLNQRRTCFCALSGSLHPSS
jgi:hypothetical protein